MRPEDEAALPPLLSRVADEAAKQGMSWGQGSFPHEPVLDRVLQDLFGTTLQEEIAQGSMMVRTIASDLTEEQLDAIFTARGAISWDCDHY